MLSNPILKKKKGLKLFHILPDFKPLESDVKENWIQFF